MPANRKDVLHFGGNGHASVRLDGARRALAQVPELALVDVPYPGFEGRPPSANLEEFLTALETFCRDRSASSAYASGIGALVALSLRARGELENSDDTSGACALGSRAPHLSPDHETLPARSSGAPEDFGIKGFQDHFARKYFLQPLDDPDLSRFFDGYLQCPAFALFFEWFTPDWLRTLERAFALHPELLGEVTVWLGGRDQVVHRAELELTERALGVRWPVVLFPGWGHYPMLDVPGEWANALRDALADP